MYRLGVLMECLSCFGWLCINMIYSLVTCTSWVRSYRVTYRTYILLCRFSKCTTSKFGDKLPLCKVHWSIVSISSQPLFCLIIARNDPPIPSIWIVDNSKCSMSVGRNSLRGCSASFVKPIHHETTLIREEMGKRKSHLQLCMLRME